MTLSQHERSLRGLVAAINSEALAETVLVPSADRLLARIKKRVKDGKNSNDGNIGKYSTKPITVSSKQFVAGGFTPTSKTKGRKSNSMYLPQGYKQLRQVQGLKSDSVNVEYSGALISNLKVKRIAKSVFIALFTKKQIAKRRFLEAKYGSIFTASRSEFQDHKKDVAKAFDAFVKNKR